MTLNVTNDTIYEVSEAFAVNLSNASAGAGIADGIGAGTIRMTARAALQAPTTTRPR
ncbi:MAG: hypothetical protein IPG23_05485 [Burkholderiales bacterium]|nr:hypothetical protein [Burkholderiales bacterium]